MNTNVKLNAAKELSIDELNAVAAGAFSTMDVNSKMFPIAVLVAPAAGIYRAAAATYAALKS